MEIFAGATQGQVHNPSPTIQHGSSTFNGYHAIQQPAGHLSAPALINCTLVVIDNIANTLNLGDSDRLHLHQVSQMDAQQQTLTLIAQVLSIAKEQAESKAAYQATIVSLREEVAEDLIKGLIRHWFSKTLNQYGMSRYISQNTERLRLDLYNTDAVARTVTNRFVAEYVNATRSNFHKVVFHSVETKESLNHFMIRIVNDYSQTGDKATSNAVKAQFALHRNVAYWIIKDRQGRAGRGEDTGFWKELEKQLENLVSKYGTSRSAPLWEAWYKRIIEEDEARFEPQETLEEEESNIEQSEDAAAAAARTSVSLIGL
ncbi:hypothetical protein EWM64_g8501 [Hericium alpestre]|uniref:Uncharacterized protein n=1 Tax=Hericium alpestre TaxID=135208 RepID=A0A4Y9ZNU2_9AGAM|nr:hypothetical protein EWM64_g8501 [Hericium alpestre]